VKLQPSTCLECRQDKLARIQRTCTGCMYDCTTSVKIPLALKLVLLGSSTTTAASCSPCSGVCGFVVLKQRDSNRPQVDCMSNSNLVLFLFLLLIICGCRLPVAVTPEQVYNSVDANTVLTVLTHKITRAVRAQVCMGLWGVWWCQHGVARQVMSLRCL
jgi:hypothetical protein